MYTISEFELIKNKVLNWANRFSTFCLLDNHRYHIQPHSEECLLAAGERRRIEAGKINRLPQLQSFINEEKGWIFGHFAYDLKNEIENLSSCRHDGIGFSDYFFFEPEVVIKIKPGYLHITATDPDKCYDEIMSISSEVVVMKQELTPVKSRYSKQEYISVIDNLKKHILRGDCYEINFCQEFYSEQAVVNPVALYKKLSAISPNPFSALYKLKDKWLVCASPERFLGKQNQTIFSQPIKGTSGRLTADRQKDEESKVWLYNSSKDRSENVMVVDLVRNDLSKVCEEGTVKVDELFGIYSFPQVHQMISTVSGTLNNNVPFTEIIRATFPMGSMTGAPKKRVMELIEQYEQTKRGIFSGAVGYINPDGDFDFNVVIRSIMYNETTSYLSYLVGSGITWYCEAEKEWEECLLKAGAIKMVLSDNKY
ncbi:MAG: anthranilate synthase component I family protein [Chitinophagaceae bacterium]|nr:anthranilate synthase component I family protein [Chitinophagaceae bacterium]